MFFFQYLVQAGLFFVVPLFLSVCLGLSALATGARLLPLSLTLLVAALGIPRLFPNVSPRLVVRCGLLALLAGTVVLLGGARRGRRAGDRLRADAADRARDRRARLAARRRHRLRRPGRAEPRGRRRPEHDDQPRRLAGHGARRLAPDRRAHSGVPGQHRAEPRDPPTGRSRRRRSSSPAGSRSSPTPTSRPRSTRPGRPRPTHRRRARRLPRRAPRRPALRARPSSPCMALLALFLAQRIPTRPIGIDERKE